ncbi:hypothetical protein PRIPAC_95460 [Pristionchus pacificus]|uniref:Dehydrogenase n=1 Tax=Pristionchus pacificus TaxID=54126 RepID=A0A2A6BIK5_PRIPA|nr:hypothetical protein PRIPAC_95460 [Pristionchus pacificus]|eukprot:PDM65765.1 dehydrogenase [Pristionchus pacificus]
MEKVRIIAYNVGFIFYNIIDPTLMTNTLGILYCKRRYKQIYGKASLNARYQVTLVFERKSLMVSVLIRSRKLCCLGTMDFVSDVLLPIGEFMWTLGQLIIFTLIDVVKAFLPIGVLPRKSIKGDICLITGSGSGLGRLMALEFAKHGCDIVLWDVNEAGNAETKKLLDGSGARVWAYTVDLSDRKDIAAKAALVKKDAGHVDILINNAGIVTGKKIFECPEELMEKTMAVNCMACLYTMKHFGQSMIERNHGHIVTIASIAGKLRVAGLVDYCASKHGAVGFHASMTDELRFLNIDGVKDSHLSRSFRVNDVCKSDARISASRGYTAHVLCATAGTDVLARVQINNAGIVTGKKIFECPEELMEKTMAVNCMACLYVDYCASKHGAVGFHASMTDELRFLNIDGVKMLALALLAVIPLMYYVLLPGLTFWREYSRQKKIASLVPGPPGLPIVGNMLTVKRSAEDMPINMIKRANDYAKLVKAILDSSEEITKGNDYDLLLPWLGRGLLLNTGDSWRHRRRLLTPTFHFSQLDTYITAMNRHSKVFVDEILVDRAGTKFDIYPLIKLCALDIICETAMGKELNAQHNPNQPYVTAVQRMVMMAVDVLSRPVLWSRFVRKLIGHDQEYMRYVNTARGYTQSVIEERRVALEKGEVEQNKRAFLDMLLLQSGENRLSIEDLKDEVETPRHDRFRARLDRLVPRVLEQQEIAAKEVAEVFKGDADRELTREDLSNMPYLDRCIKEAMRMFPPVPIVMRKLQNDFECGSYTLPRGTTVNICPIAIHRNEMNFENAQSFDPDRFLPERSVNRHAFDYIPFSAGPRNCIGQRFASYEEKVVMSWLLRRYRFESDMALNDNPPLAEAILRPKYGCIVRMYPREQHPISRLPCMGAPGEIALAATAFGLSGLVLNVALSTLLVNGSMAQSIVAYRVSLQISALHGFLMSVCWLVAMVSHVFVDGLYINVIFGPVLHILPRPLADAVYFMGLLLNTGWWQLTPAP